MEARKMRLLLQSSYISIIVIICGVLIVVSQYVSPLIALKGSYFPLGLIVAGILYHKYSVKEITVGRQRKKSTELNHKQFGKVVFILAASALTLTFILDDRLPALLLTLPAGYTVLALQLRAGESKKWLLAELGALFSIGPVTKYLTTGFYFAGGDTFVHVLYTEKIIKYGTTSVGTLFYRKFPAVHTLAAEASLISHLQAYDSLILIWISTYLFLALVVYIIARLISEPDIAICVAVATMSLGVISYYSTVIFPQAIAVVMVLFFLFLILRANTNERHIVRYSILSTLTIFATVVTHHLTIILFIPIFAVFSAIGFINRRQIYADISTHNISIPRLLPIYTAAISAFGYWTLIAPNFYRGVTLLGLARVRSLTRAIASTATRTGSSSVLTFGTTVPELTPANAALWLITPNGMYFTILTVLICLGIIVLYRMEDRNYILSIMCAIGAFGSTIMLRTPLVIKSLQRLRLVWSVFFGFLVGVGIYWTVALRSNYEYEKLVPLALIVVLGVSGPLVAADDLKLRFDKANQDTYLQHSLSEREYETLRTTSTFVDKLDQEVATLRTARLTLARFGTSTTTPNISPKGITADTRLLLYRQRWSEYQIPHQTGVYFNTVIMSQHWLSKNVRESDKIYTTGETGLLYGNRSSVSLQS